MAGANPGLFAFNGNQTLAQEDICHSSLSPLELHAFSHDYLLIAHMRRGSPDKVHFIPGVTTGQSVVSSQHHLRLHGQSYDNCYITDR